MQKNKMLVSQFQGYSNIPPKCKCIACGSQNSLITFNRQGEQVASIRTAGSREKNTFLKINLRGKEIKACENFFKSHGFNYSKLENFNNNFCLLFEKCHAFMQSIFLVCIYQCPFQFPLGCHVPSPFYSFRRRNVNETTRSVKERISHWGRC